jgi:hypothetical protein
LINKGYTLKDSYSIIMEGTYKLCKGQVSCGKMKHISEFYTNKNGYTRCNCKTCYSKQVYLCRQQKMKKQSIKYQYDIDELRNELTSKINELTKRINKLSVK